MSREQIENLLTDYLSEQLPDEHRREFEQWMDADPSLRREAEELLATWELMKKPIEQDPDEILNAKFYAFLNHEKAQQNVAKPQSRKVIPLGSQWFSWSKYMAVAASVAAAFFVGRITAPEKLIESQGNSTEIAQKTKPNSQSSLGTPTSSSVLNEIGALKKEMRETKELVMLSMLKQGSASERLKAVSYSYELLQPDRKVLDALIKTLNHDSSVNVRLAAADALSHFGNETKVRDALIQTLQRQQEPMLQMAVIEILVSLREKRALPEMEKLADQEQAPDFVRDKAKEGVKYLSI